MFELPAKPIQSRASRPQPWHYLMRRLAGSLLLASGLVSLPAAAWDMAYLLGLLNATPDGGWVRVNVNKYSDAWVTGPDALSPSSESDPARVIFAWSSMAWDTRRGRILLWGGGHANYKGNEIYIWQGSNGLWTRGSVSSRVTQYGSTSTFFAADDAAPQSAHTYDNNNYLPVNDMFVTLGGAAFNSGGNFAVRNASGNPVRAGPWAWDPLKADPNMVGGTTGSGYDPTTLGGQMWTNLQGRWVGTEAPEYLEGATAYVQEGGQDVIYITAAAATGNPSLYRYQPGNIRSGQIGRYEEVGTNWNSPTFQHAAVVDTRHGLYVFTANVAGGLGVFDLTQSNAADPDANRDIFVTLRFPDGTKFIGNGDYGIAYDHVRDQVVLWNSFDPGTVYETQAAFDLAGNVLPNWTIRRFTSTTAAVPAGKSGTGVLGKWHFIPDLGAFVALDNFDYGTRDAPVWLYRPVGWTPPGTMTNAPPAATLTAPVSGTTVMQSATVALSANASDSDGWVTRVDFYAGPTLIGSAPSEPYTTTWTNVPPGTYALTAVAYDNSGGSTTSAPVTLVVTAVPASGTLTLQDGLSGYAGTRDAYLSTYAPSTNFGTGQSLIEAPPYSDLVRFAIFQSEGGPLPDGATIVSATLSLYKSTSYDYTYLVSRILRDWSETQATWTQARNGQAWSVAGAKGVDTDYAATPDATVALGWSPQWLNADVTQSVRAVAAGTPNYGWRLVGVSGNGNDKQFLSREYAGDPTLRPKLVVQYGSGSSNVPPTVSLTSPSNGSSATAPATVLVSANASDSDGTVSRVDFYAGTTLIGSDSSAPYSVTWGNVPAGSYTLTAVAVDNLGASTTSAAVQVAVNAITIASSANPVVAGTNVTFTASVTGNAPTGGVTFADAGTTIAGCNAVPLTGAGSVRTATCATSTLAVGIHSITAGYSGDTNNQFVTSAPLSQSVTATGGSDTIWLDDAVPAGAVVTTNSGNPWNTAWNWVGSNPTPNSGALAHTSPGASGTRQHYFYNAATTLAVGTGDTLFAYVYIDAASPPKQLLLQWNDGSWEHRAYWGTNLIGWGTDGTTSLRYMGPIPAAGQWVRLQVPAAQVGLAGRTLNGMAFTHYDGVVTWDSAGKSGGGNVPPSVTLTSPANGASAPAPGSFVVSANAIDSDGTVSRVDFFAGSTPIGSDSTPPYSVAWSNVVAGSYTVTAVAVDNLGASATSSPVSVTVTAPNAPPMVSLSSPASGANAAAPGSFVVSANASDADGTVSRVDFYAGTTLIGSDSSAPYSVTWGNVPAGSYTLTAVAVDNLGASTTSAAVKVAVNAITIASSANPVVAGTNVTFTASVTGNAPTGGVTFADAGTTIAGCNAVPLTGAGSVRTATCATSSLAVGTHSIAASYGGDANNGVVTSAPLSQSVTATGGSDTVWLDDAVPSGAVVTTNSGNPWNTAWNWVGSNPTPNSGALAHTSPGASGTRQHYFYNAATTLAVGTGDTLFAYVYIDAASPPKQLLLQWNDGSWEHRAYWGTNVIGWGTDGTTSLRYMGPIPAAGQWVRLQVPAAQVGLAGRTLNGMAFTHYDGVVMWDSAGKTP